MAPPNCYLKRVCYLKRFILFMIIKPCFIQEDELCEEGEPEEGKCLGRKINTNDN